MPEYKLAYDFLKNVLKVDDNMFNHAADAVYLENNALFEERGPLKHRYLRPSKAVRFMKKESFSTHHKNKEGGWKSHDWGYVYHGTNPNS